MVFIGTSNQLCEYLLSIFEEAFQSGIYYHQLEHLIIGFKRWDQGTSIIYQSSDEEIYPEDHDHDLDAAFWESTL